MTMQRRSLMDTMTRLKLANGTYETRPNKIAEAATRHYEELFIPTERGENFEDWLNIILYPELGLVGVPGSERGSRARRAGHRLLSAAKDHGIYHCADRGLAAASRRVVAVDGRTSTVCHQGLSEFPSSGAGASTKWRSPRLMQQARAGAHTCREHTRARCSEPASACTQFGRHVESNGTCAPEFGSPSGRCESTGCELACAGRLGIVSVPEASAVGTTPTTHPEPTAPPKGVNGANGSLQKDTRSTEKVDWGEKPW